MATQRIGGAEYDLRAKNSQFLRAMAQNRAALRRQQESFDRLRAGAGRASAALRGFIGVAGALAAVRLGRSLARPFSELEDRLASVEAVTQASATEMERFEAAVRRLGGDTRFTAAEAAAALQALGTAGFEAGEALEALPTALSLAVAGELELAESATILSGSLRGFRLRARGSARAADVLADAARSTNTTVRQLGLGFRDAAPVSAEFGVSIETTAAALGVLADNMLRGARGGVAYRSLLTRLAAPAGAAAEELARFGIAAEDVDVAARGLVPVLDTLADAARRGLNPFVAGGETGGLAIAILAQSADRVRELAEQFEGAGGAADEMAATIDDTLVGAVRRMGSAFAELAITLGGDSGVLGLARRNIEGIAAGVQSITGALRDPLGAVRDGAGAPVAESARRAALRYATEPIPFGRAGADGAYPDPGDVYDLSAAYDELGRALERLRSDSAGGLPGLDAQREAAAEARLLEEIESGLAETFAAAARRLQRQRREITLTAAEYRTFLYVDERLEALDERRAELSEEDYARLRERIIGQARLLAIEERRNQELRDGREAAEAAADAAERAAAAQARRRSYADTLADASADYARDLESQAVLIRDGTDAYERRLFALQAVDRYRRQGVDLSEREAAALEALAAAEYDRHEASRRGLELLRREADWADTLRDGFRRFTEDVLVNFRSIGDAARSLGQLIYRALVTRLIVSPLETALFGAAQHGGLHRGLTLVGEAGPELVDFRRPGRVYTADELSSAIAGAQRRDAPVINFAPVIQSADPQAVAGAVRLVYPEFAAAVRAEIAADAARPSRLRYAVRGR